jgi:hypothetical protein
VNATPLPLRLPCFTEGFLDPRFDRPWIVGGSRFESEERQFGFCEQIVEEFVALSPIAAAMRGIVKFNRGQWSKIFSFNEDKIDMFAGY